MKIPGGFDALFRQATPLVLLAVLATLVFEHWLPGTAWLRTQFGEQFVLRGCIAVLACYVLILWGEALRLHTMLTGVLQALRQFGQEHGGGGGGSARAEAAARNPKARLEAAKLLVAAMGSDDPAIRATSHHNLVRLVGEDFGQDPGKWQDWLRRQESGGR